MGGSKDTDTNTLPDVFFEPEFEDNIHSLCTDARDEVELHGGFCKPAAIFIGKLYSDLHDCTVLFRRTVDAARLSDPYHDVPLPTNRNELKTEFDGMMAAYNLYNIKEMKLRKQCIQKVKAIEVLLENTMNGMTLDECVHLYGFNPHILSDYVLPKLIFITNLVFRFRGMSETLLYCYQKRLGLIKDEKDKDAPLDLDSSMDDENEIYDDDTLKYMAMKEFDDYNSDEDLCNSDEEFEFDESSMMSLSVTGIHEEVIESCSEIEQDLPLYCTAVKSLGLFIVAQTVTYLATAVTDLFLRLF